jgi:hypothetical protein
LPGELWWATADLGGLARVSCDEVFSEPFSLVRRVVTGDGEDHPEVTSVVRTANGSIGGPCEATGTYLRVYPPASYKAVLVPAPLRACSNVFSTSLVTSCTTFWRLLTVRRPKQRQRASSWVGHRRRFFSKNARGGSDCHSWLARCWPGSPTVTWTGVLMHIT